MKQMRTDVNPGQATFGDWRRRRLVASGFEGRLAEQLTGDDAGVDLHELLVLLDRGCPPHLAARILAPLDRKAP